MEKAASELPIETIPPIVQAYAMPRPKPVVNFVGRG